LAGDQNNFKKDPGLDRLNNLSPMCDTAQTLRSISIKLFNTLPQDAVYIMLECKLQPINRKLINEKEIIMFTRLLLVMFTLTGGLLIMTGPVQAEQNAAIYVAESSPLENTEINVRDKDNTTLTPEDQKETKKDIKITAHIRKAVVKDKSLSMDAQNAKIITRGGVVTLRGPVANEAESKKLEKIAKKTRGVVKVDNQLEIKAP
jgi:hyperosmotically inducible protein